MSSQSSRQQPTSRARPAQGGSFQPSSPPDSGAPWASSWTQDDEALSTIESRSFASDQYLRGSYLGSGGWSTVYKVLRVSDRRVLAGKSSRTLQQLHKEARILRRLSHNHILEFVSLHEEVDNPAATLLVTELCAGGTLQTRIDHASGGMGRVEILQVTLQLSEALRYLHDRHMFHSDVKPRNVLVRCLQPVDVVLADCADIKEEGKCLGPPQGTQAYWSPEILKHRRHHGRSDDIWALGITLLGMIAQWPQMPHTKKDIIKYSQRCFDHVQALKEMNPEHGILGLLGQTMAWSAERRASAAECCLLAEQLLEGERVGEKGLMQDDKGVGIKAPEDFRPISFW